MKFGIIGCGRIAERHAKLIQSFGSLVAVCDIIEEKAKKLAAIYNATACNSEIDMLQHHPEIDIVAVCSPNGLHAIHTINSLNAGCHVICEKPMALNVDDCKKMISNAEKNNKKLFVVKQNRFNPPVEAVKQLIDEGRLGKIFNVQLNCFWNRNNEYYASTWKGSKSLDGGTLFTQFSHFIDLLYWLIGDIDEVVSYTANYHHKNIIEFEDTGVAIFKFTSGPIGAINFSINSFDKNMEGSLTVLGEKGIVKIGGEYLNKLEYQHIKDYEIKDLGTGNPANYYGTYSGSMSNHDRVYENVFEVLDKGKVFKNSSFDSLKTVEIINKIYSSAKIIN